MVIKENEKLSEYITQKDMLYESYSDQLQELNEEFQPIINKLTKQKKDRLYAIGLIVFTIIFGIIATALHGELFPQYMIPTFFSIAGAGLVVMIIITIYTLKILKANHTEWMTKTYIIDKQRKQGNEYLEMAAAEVFRVICLNNNYDDFEIKKMELSENDFNIYYDSIYAKEKEKILESIGEKASPTDILEYYQSWGKRVTGKSEDSYDSFLESRKKRHLGT